MRKPVNLNERIADIRAKSRAKAKPTIIDMPEEPKPEVVEPKAESDEDTLFAKMRKGIDDYMASISTPSWMRQAVAALLGLIAMGSTWYSCIGLINILTTGAVTLTGSAFIAFLVSFIGLFIGLMLAVTASKMTYDFVMEFDVRTVKSRVTNFFRGNDTAAV